MFSSVKEKFYSVVQDGIELNNTVRRKLSEAQQAKLSPRKVEEEITANINPHAGGEILTKYQNEWKQLHEDAEKNAKLAENIDTMMTDIHKSVKYQLDNIVNINTIFATLPKVTSAVDECVSNLKELNTLFDIVEHQLIELENTIELSEFKQRQSEHTFQLTMYKEKKFAGLERSRVSLAKQQASAHRVVEQQQRGALQERQRAAHHAFLNDIAAYKTQGTLPKKPEKNDSLQKQPALEEIQLDTENTAELDDFLNK